MIFRNLASKTSRIPVEPGMTFRKVGTGAFGQQTSALWTVEKLKKDFKGLPHVHISLVSDRTQKSVIAQNVILDPHYFVSYTQ